MNDFRTVMAEINRIPTEVFRDLRESNVTNCWQKQDCGFIRERVEVASISNISTQEMEAVSISVINVSFIATSRDSF
jgi:hypothetical protein